MAPQSPLSSVALLIEPDPDRALVFQELMASAYHASVTPDVVSSLDEGLAYLQTHHVPLIFINLSLPGQAGRQAVEQVRQVAPSSAVIGLHQTTDTTILAGAIRAGAHEVLSLIPLSAESLRLSVSTALIRASSPLTTIQPTLSTQANPTLSLSLAKVAHDLNNCLTSINGYADILLARLPEEDPSLGCAEQIKLACTRAESLIKQLPQTTSPSSVSQLPTSIDSAPAA